MTERFTEEIRGQILGAMKTGVSYQRAAQTAGIGRSTLWRWLKRGEADHAEGRRTSYARFWDDFKRAESQALGQVEMNVWQQSRDDWRAGAWLLSKKARGEYGDSVTEAARQQIVDQMVRELFDRVESRMSPGAYQELLAALEDPEPNAPLALA